MDLKSIIMLVMVSLAAQEKPFIVKELTALLTFENTRVGANLTSTEIDALVATLTKLAFAEQDVLLNKLTAKLATK